MSRLIREMQSHSYASLEYDIPKDATKSKVGRCWIFIPIQSHKDIGHPPAWVTHYHCACISFGIRDYWKRGRANTVSVLWFDRAITGTSTAT